MIERRILRLFYGVASLTRADVLVLFSEAEQDAAQAAIDGLVRDGKLREDRGRLWPAKAP